MSGPVRVIMSGASGFWPRHLATGLTEHARGRLVSRPLIWNVRHPAFLLDAVHILEADLLVRVGVKVSSRFFRTLRAIRTLGTTPVLYWTGTDVVSLGAALESGVLSDSDRALLASVPSLAGTAHLAEELESLGVSARVAQMPIPARNVPSTPAPLPTEFTVLTYLPKRLDFYGAPAIMAAARSLPDVRFLVMGEGSPEDVPNNVELLGQVDDAAACYERASVVVRMVEHDAIGGTVIEGLLNGREIIYSYDIPHVHHVEFGDAEGLTSAIRGLAEAHAAGDLAHNSAGREWALAHFDTAACFEHLRDVLLDIAAHPRRARRSS